MDAFRAVNTVRTFNYPFKTELGNNTIANSLTKKPKQMNRILPSFTEAPYLEAENWYRKAIPLANLGDLVVLDGKQLPKYSRMRYKRTQKDHHWRLTATLLTPKTRTTTAMKYTLGKATCALLRTLAGRRHKEK